MLAYSYVLTTSKWNKLPNCIVDTQKELHWWMIMKSSRQHRGRRQIRHTFCSAVEVRCCNLAVILDKLCSNAATTWACKKQNTKLTKFLTNYFYKIHIFRKFSKLKMKMLIFSVPHLRSRVHCSLLRWNPPHSLNQPCKYDFTSISQKLLFITTKFRIY